MEFKERQNLIKKRKNSIFHAGDKPGDGTYKCIHCPQKIRLDENIDTLPRCPKCSRTEWAYQ